MQIKASFKNIKPRILLGTIFYRIGIYEDKKIRQSHFKKDKDFNQKIKQEMEEEQSMLKSYFKQYKQPVAEDPTIMKRQAGEQKALMLKQALSPFRVFHVFFNQYWNLQCATPQERYVLKLCKENTKKQITTGIIGSVAITSLVSYQMRMIMSPKFHILSFLVGITSGFLYGVINSTQYSLQKFESLGQNYALGRSSLLEISKFRMDSKK